MHPSHRTNKVGIVPYARHADELRFLIHLPKAKNPEQQNDLMWGLVRGTVRNINGEDLRTLEALHATSPEHIEPAEATARHEALEEAGLQPEDFAASELKDHGLLDYATLRGEPYPVHFFSAPLMHADADALMARNIDAVGLAFKPLAEIEMMATRWQFKPGYVPILKTIAREIAAN